MHTSSPWPDTRLTDLLGIEHPIIQAPMAGSTTPALAAAVSNAGGLGSLGCAKLSLDALEDEIGQIRRASNRPFNLNFFANAAPKVDQALWDATVAAMAPFYAELGLDTPSRTHPESTPGFSEAQRDLVLSARPNVVSFHFGLPPDALWRPLQAAGILILCSATKVAEARILDAAGIDAIIAQGWEAGGHRGSFETTRSDQGVGTLALVPQIADAVRVPVIAAGGIADGRGIAAAFALGASGVQIGTAYLSTPEATTLKVHQDALSNASDTDTELTLAHSGRPARAFSTAYIRAMAGQKVPEFPLMYDLAAPLKMAEDTDKSIDMQFMLYGQAAALSRRMDAARLTEELAADALARMRALGG